MENLVWLAVVLLGAIIAFLAYRIGEQNKEFEALRKKVEDCEASQKGIDGQIKDLDTIAKQKMDVRLAQLFGSQTASLQIAPTDVTTVSSRLTGVLLGIISGPDSELKEKILQDFANNVAPKTFDDLPPETKAKLLEGMVEAAGSRLDFSEDEDTLQELQDAAFEQLKPRLPEIVDQAFSDPNSDLRQNLIKEISGVDFLDDEEIWGAVKETVGSKIPDILAADLDDPESELRKALAEAISEKVTENL